MSAAASPSAAGRARTPSLLWRTVNGMDDAAGSLHRWVSPVLDVVVRIWIAQTFVLGAFGRMMGEGPLSFSPDLRGVAETVLPLLLIVGLATRPAALVLFALLCVATAGSGVGSPTAGTGLVAGLTGHVLADPRLLALVWYAVAGAGPLSLDALLRRGIRRLAPSIASLSSRMKAVAAPLVLLAIRAAAAWAVWTVGAETALWPLAAVAAIALAVGIGGRFTAAAVLAASLVPGIGDAWPALLAALLVATGPGILTLDALIVRLARARSRSAAAGHRDKVVIVGGGFAGIAAALELRDAPCDVTLVDRRNYHLFQPLLYQVATSALSPADIATPVRALFRDQPNVRIVLGECTGVDTQAKRVRLRDGSLDYDHLVLATGAQTGYFGNDHWAKNAPGLKDIDDATEIRRRLLTAFEWAETAASPRERAACMTFVVVGGGPTGVELAGAIAELAHHGLADDFAAIDPKDARVILVQGADRLLPPFPESLSRETARSLKALGVEVMLDARVTDCLPDGVVVGDEKIETHCVFWAAGVSASPVAEWLGIEPADRGGRVEVGPDLSVPGLPDVFVPGDPALSKAWDGKPVPGLAASAKVMGAHVGRVLARRVAGRKEPGPFVYKHLGSLATIGRDSAVADFGRVRVDGTLAWWLWGGVHLLLLDGVRNRLSVGLDWLWAYLTYRRGTRLITGDHRHVSAGPPGRTLAPGSAGPAPNVIDFRQADAS